LGRQLREGDRAIDVGACTGGCSIIMAALCGHSGEVVAFEPNPAARLVLLDNIKLNPGLKAPVVETAAVSDSCGAATLYARPGADVNSGLVSSSQPGTRPLPATTVSLDAYLSKHKGRTPRLVKIDTEGAEIRVLQGARDLLASDAEILCEIHPYAWPLYGNTLDELRSLASMAGRRVRYIHENHEMGNHSLYGIVTLERVARSN
jgi:FkbM family methyltransferase